MNLASVITLKNAIGAATRLSLVYAGVDPHDVYNAERNANPQADEHYLLEIIEGARDAWRPIWRRGSDR